MQKKMRAMEENSSCVAGQRKKTFSSRWSLRQLLYSSPILNRKPGTSLSSGSTKVTKPHGKEDKRPLDLEKGITTCDVEVHQTSSKTSTAPLHVTKSAECSRLSIECPLCLSEFPPSEPHEMTKCGHHACIPCLQQYMKIEITESRVSISCPECSELVHPNEIRDILNDPVLYGKYEDFMVRRVLAVDPDTRWCPAPDCCFAVIASECASCPKLKCERPGCDSYFCYHCKAEWHPNQTCDAARAQRSPNIRSSSIAYSHDSQHNDIKPCPGCQVLIVKMDDGSCNHMMCAVCGAEFCWLCMKEISDLHYLSPSGCTFWGKKPWSRKKKILWQLGTLVGAPVGIALIAGITVPAMTIGIPVWIGRKMYTRYKNSNKHKRNAAIVGGVVASIIISPILASIAVGIGVPILLFYVYGVVPVSLCRSGGCGGNTSAQDDTSSEIDVGTGSVRLPPDTISIDIRVPNPSIGEASLSMASGSHVLHDPDRDSQSATSVGKRLDAHANKRFSIGSLTESCNASINDDASTRALAGSIHSKQANGCDSSSYTQDDCSSERVHFDDNISFLNIQVENSNTGCKPKLILARLDKSNDGKETQCDISHPEEKSKKYSSRVNFLRNQFFHSTTSDSKSATKNLDDKHVIEFADEVLNALKK